MRGALCRLERPRWLAIALPLLLLVACRHPDSASESGGSSAPPAAASPKTASTRFELRLEGGPSLAFEPNAGGYAISSGGESWGKLRFDSDRVKLSDASGTEKAKVKAKDYGFKLYDGDSELFKFKRRGSALSIKRADDRELGEISPQGGRIAGESVSVSRDGADWLVQRAGRSVAHASGGVRAEAAALLALSELTLEQRVAVFGFDNAGLAP